MIFFHSFHHSYIYCHLHFLCNWMPAWICTIINHLRSNVPWASRCIFDRRCHWPKGQKTVLTDWPRLSFFIAAERSLLPNQAMCSLHLFFAFSPRVKFAWENVARWHTLTNQFSETSFVYNPEGGQWVSLTHCSTHAPLKSLGTSYPVPAQVCEKNGGNAAGLSGTKCRSSHSVAWKKGYKEFP